MHPFLALNIGFVLLAAGLPTVFGGEELHSLSGWTRFGLWGAMACALAGGYFLGRYREVSP